METSLLPTRDVTIATDVAAGASGAAAELRPAYCLLAAPVADEDEVLKRFGSPVWTEDKYDGIRAQLHKLGEQVRLYSRDLNEVSDSYPEVIASASKVSWDGILDGELLAFRDGMAMPFQQLQARLGRKNPSEDMQREIPVIYVAFDVLAHGLGGGAAVEPTLAARVLENGLDSFIETLGETDLTAVQYGTLRALVAPDRSGLIALSGGSPNPSLQRTPPG